MIVSGGSRANWRFFAKHLTNAEKNENVRLIEFRGLAGRTPLEALREMDALASGTRCKRFLYHADINPQAHETLTEAQWEQAADILERELGLEGHSRFVVEHEKDGRTHRHVIWSRIDPETLRAVSDSNDFAKHQAAARAMEQEFELEAVPSSLGPDRVKRERERRPKSWEQFRGSQTGINPARVKEEVTALWRDTTGAEDFAAALEERGYILCRGDRRDFCIVDAAGDEHSLARRIEGAKAKDIRERMAGIDRDALPSVAEGRELARAGQDADTGEPEPQQAIEPLREEAPASEQMPAPESPPLHPMDREMAVYVRQFEEHGRLLTLPPIAREWESPHETAWGRACRVANRLYDAFERVVEQARDIVQDWRQRFSTEREQERDGPDMER